MIITYLERYNWRVAKIFLAVLFAFGCAHAYYQESIEHKKWLEYLMSTGHEFVPFNPFNEFYFNLHLLAFLLVIIYPLTIKRLTLHDLINPVTTWFYKEIAIISLLVIGLLLISFAAALEKHFLASLVYVGAFMLVLVFDFLYFSKAGENILHQSNKQSFRFYRKGLALGVLLLLLMALLVFLKNLTERTTEDLYEFFFDLTMLLVILLLGYVILSWLFKHWKELRKARSEKIKAELAHLKSQVNPHFFFNTLNNLYGLINSDQEMARKLVLKLSEMMRYTIYEGEKEWVKLEEEIVYLRKYLELHQMRYQKKIEVDFQTSFEEKEYRVMPLLFIVLVENAFKHGVENLVQNAYIKMDLNVQGDEIHFLIVNNFDEHELPKRPGIGLKNLRRRLELVYPGEHHISINKDQDTYSVKLMVKAIQI